MQFVSAGICVPSSGHTWGQGGEGRRSFPSGADLASGWEEKQRERLPGEDRLPALKPVTGVHTWPPLLGSWPAPDWSATVGASVGQRRAEGRAGGRLSAGGSADEGGPGSALPGAESYLSCWTLGISCSPPLLSSPGQAPLAVSPGRQVLAGGESGRLPGHVFSRSPLCPPGQGVRSISQLRLIHDVCPSPQ